MALWVCKDCKCSYSVGAAKCPQCGSKKWAEQGSKGDPTLAVEVEATADAAEGGGTDA